MDVRCEKCLTVYELDEAQVGPAGVTVKCTQCGALFKVRRKETAEFAVPVAAQSGARAPAAAPRPSAPATRPAPVPPSDEGWRVRIAATGEVLRFKEMTRLQQWIVERRVHRPDEISRDGRTWKPLGGVPDLEPFFRTVEQADAAARAAQLPDRTEVDTEESLALATTAPMERPGRETSGPIQLGDVPVGAEPAFTGTPAFVGGGEPTFVEGSGRNLPPLPPVVDELAGLDDEPPRRRLGPILLLGLGVVLAVGVGAGILLGLSGGKKNSRAEQLRAEGDAHFLLDTDESFRKAAELYAQAHGADEKYAGALAGLAEVHATWAFYLREDARAVGAAGGDGSALEKSAAAHLEDAKRYGGEALVLDPDGPRANRAMAEVLRVEGSSAAEVERYLARAAPKGEKDVAAAFVAGALAYREGRFDDAAAKLDEADRLARTLGQEPLLRSLHLQARVAQKKEDGAAVRRFAAAVLARSPNHERARALARGAAPPAEPPAAAVAPPTPVEPAAAPSEPDDKKKLEAAGPEDYARLVEKADRLAENGRAAEARKLYEKALAQKADGVEAITGLGYCDLDREKYISAVESFKRALAISPNFGEALIGLAESYKTRGDSAQAMTYYRRYLEAQPGGPKAAMAQKNLRELEAKAGPPKPPPAPAPPPAPEPAAPAGDEEVPPPRALPRPPPPSADEGGPEAPRPTPSSPSPSEDTPPPP